MNCIWEILQRDLNILADAISILNTATGEIKQFRFFAVCLGWAIF